MKIRGIYGKIGSDMRGKLARNKKRIQQNRQRKLTKLYQFEQTKFHRPIYSPVAASQTRVLGPGMVPGGV